MGITNKRYKKGYRKKKTGKALFLLTLLAVLIAGVFFYRYSIYRPTQEAKDAIAASTSEVKIDRTVKGQIAFVPNEIKAGLIFYPGGMVDYEAYAPLMLELADRGLLCVIMEMPADIAFLRPNAANGIKEQWPEVTKWYLSGHSLGGLVASSYLDEHAKDFDGLILLASYSITDLTQYGLYVLMVYGSNDKVLNLSNYEKSKSNLPPSFVEAVIEGGNHAGFGCYGAQKGDGEASITQEEQWSRTVDVIEAWMEAMN